MAFFMTCSWYCAMHSDHNTNNNSSQYLFDSFIINRQPKKCYDSLRNFSPRLADVNNNKIVIYSLINLYAWNSNPYHKIELSVN